VKCNQCPTPSDPIDLYDQDKDEHTLITGCPLNHVPEEIGELMQIVEAWEQGVPPISGGVLDQTDSILKAIGVVQSERSKLMEKRLKNGK